ncbi:hypothetical protein PH5382_03821 [Phaeobacter sp. CECT 5382]|uniref:hypothetical protein n=1 Tax=Phaeobacter sp. CECT 5382 TaxID=1712645 RepID=UPI0006DAEE61|nr:hypothetical protein [Phaeobacter sp. CECT 5382]CUH89868.1 hypothetical protein PH5382_03821 [Phaeobacter sp. CECT 5382]
MSEFHEVDWKNASVQDRVTPTKVLFRLMVQLSKKLDVHFDVLLEEAQEQAISKAEDPHRNFEKGKIAKERSHKIHEWIGRNHFEWAQEQEPELFQVPRKNDWDQFLENAVFQDGLAVVDRLGFGVASRLPPEEMGGVTLRLGQVYGFELVADSLGQVVAFEECGGTWHPLPLGETPESLKADLRLGKNQLPRTGNGKAMQLYEHHDSGPHRFIFVVREGGKLPVDRKSIAKLAKTTPLLVYQARTYVI